MTIELITVNHFSYHSISPLGTRAIIEINRLKFKWEIKREKIQMKPPKCSSKKDYGALPCLFLHVNTMVKPFFHY